MGSNLFTSALSGMNAAQIGLSTTQHNIANVNTPGFTRQEVLVSSRAGSPFGGGFIGQGIDVSGVRRIYDQFLSTQVMQEQAQASYLTTYYNAIKQIDNLIADPAAGAAPAMRDFFSAVSSVANNPESVPARQTVLSNAQYAVNRFQAIDQRLTNISDSLNSQISGSVDSVNSYAQQIAALNGSIKRAIATGQGQQPNDLLDQRDQLISKLNVEVKATALRQADGTMSVFIGSGQTLVVDEQAMSLQVVKSAIDPSKMDIAYRNNNTSVTLQQSSLRGGNIGAYLTFRDQSLEPMRNELGRVAMAMAMGVNQQNQAGLDLRGQKGAALFNVASPRVDAGANNQGNAAISASIADLGALTTSDYQLKVNGVNNYTLVRMSDNFLTNITSALPQTVDGIKISLASGALAVGDSFLIRPAANAARDIALMTNDPAAIAAAAPMRGVAGTYDPLTGALISANTGNATIASGAVNLNPVSITFSNPTTYSLTSSNATIGGAGTTVTVASTVNMAVGMPVTGGGFPAGTTITSITNGTTFMTNNTAVPPAAVGQTLQVGSFLYTAPNISFNGWTAQIAGVVAGDTFTVARDPNSISTAAMLTTSAATNTGTISPVSVTPDWTVPFSVTFNAVAQTYTVTGAVPAVAAPIAYTPGSPINLSYNGWTAQITGTPATGDVFTFEPNTNATGDNRNALLMANLQTSNILDNGTTSVQAAYSQLVGRAGAKTAELAVTSEAQNNMVTETIKTQQSMSGVNLDEEAANLLRFQRAYEAAAKALQVSNTMFDALLAIGG